MTQTPTYKIVLRLIAFIALLVGCLRLIVYVTPKTTQIARMEAPRLDYHAPTKCKSNSLEHVYYSVGETVFAYPYVANPAYISPVEPSLLRDAPDPSEEIGCLGNPLQLRSLPIGTENLRGEMFWNWRPHPDDYWNTHGVGLLELTCKHATIVESLPGGLKACRVKPTNPPDLPTEVWPASYVADHAKYTTPNGKPFVVNCSPGRKDFFHGPCEVGYSLRPDLGISYTFDPYKTSAPLPVEQIFDEDRKLQNKFETVVVKDFKWPTPIKLPKEN
jgi:hypothetical protein